MRHGAISTQARLFAAVNELDACPAPSSESAAGSLMANVADALVPGEFSMVCLGEGGCGLPNAAVQHVIHGCRIAVLPQWTSSARGHSHPVTAVDESTGLVVTGRHSDVGSRRPPPTFDFGHLWLPFGAEHMLAALVDFPNDHAYLASYRTTRGFSDEEIRLMDQLRAVASRLLRRAAVSTLAEAAGSTWGLAPREAEVFAFAGVGLPLSSIASTLGLSVGTVRTHVGKAYAKAAVRSRAAVTSALLDVEPLALGTARHRFVPGGAGALTRQEAAVLRVAATGRTTSAIASVIGISAETVKTHLANVYRKLGVHNRSQALLLFGTSGAWSDGSERIGDKTRSGHHRAPVGPSDASHVRIPAH